MKGMFVAMTVMNCTFASSGSPAMYSSASTTCCTSNVGSGSIVNDTKFTYNSFGQLTADYQSHSGAVNTGSSPKVEKARNLSEKVRGLIDENKDVAVQLLAPDPEDQQGDGGDAHHNQKRHR